MMRDDYRKTSQESLSRVLESYRTAGDALTSLAQNFETWQDEVQGDHLSMRSVDLVDIASEPVSSVVVRCLGRFALQMDGEPVSIPNGGRPLAVLKFLAVRGGKPTPRDLLLEALWPGADPEASTNRLRVAVHALRRDLGSEAAHLVGHLDGCYAFSPESGAFVDAAEFELAWRNVVRSEREGDSEAAILHLEKAESLYAGDFLEDDVYEDWTMVEREFLRDIYLNVLTKLAEHSLKTGDYAGCLDRCRQIIRHDVCNEEAYKSLIAAHIALGQPGRALQWFSICETNLRRELNVQPSESLIALKESITTNPQGPTTNSAAV